MKNLNRLVLVYVRSTDWNNIVCEVGGRQHL
jgi:hypothetical protein